MYGIRFKEALAVSHWLCGEETVEITLRPWLTMWDEAMLPQLRKEFHPRKLGYRFLERLPERCADVYARPLPIWLYLRTCLAFSRFFWRVLSGLYWWGVIHKTTPKGCAFRWRDLRLGPGREYKVQRRRPQNPDASS